MSSLIEHRFGLSFKQGIRPTRDEIELLSQGVGQGCVRAATSSARHEEKDAACSRSGGKLVSRLYEAGDGRTCAVAFRVVDELQRASLCHATWVSKRCMSRNVPVRVTQPG